MKGERAWNFSQASFRFFFRSPTASSRRLSLSSIDAALSGPASMPIPSDSEHVVDPERPGPEAGGQGGGPGPRRGGGQREGGAAHGAMARLLLQALHQG